MDLDQLLDKWENSDIRYLEVERFISLLIIDNKRLERVNKDMGGWHEVVKHCEEIF